MRVWTWAVGIVAAAALSGAAQAATRTFAANSIIIPEDVCYQSAQSNTGWGSPPPYCVYPTNKTSSGDGTLLAYGLVYRLLQQNVTIYVIVNPTKTKIDDIDFSVTAPSGSPVALYKRTIGSTTQFLTTEFFTSGSTINYRGMPFIIDAADHDRALSLIQANAVFEPTFNAVVLHVAKQSFQAPVAMAMSSAPPKIALLNVGGAASNVLTGYLTAAGLNTATAGGVYPTSSGEIYDLFNNDSDFINDGLIAGGYQILWSPHWVGTGDPQAPQVLQHIGVFVDRGKAYFSECASIETQEGSYNAGSTSVSVPPNDQFQTTGGVWKNGLNSGFGSGAGDSWVYADPANVYVQHGDFQYQNVGGHIHSWQPNTAVGSTYKPGILRMITSADTVTASNNNWDLETLTRKDNDPNKGPIIYLGGHNYQGQVAGTRLVLNTLLFLGQAVVTSELARSSPIVYSDGKTYQGTYIQSSASANAYPPVAGHFREYAAGSLSSANVTGFSKIAADWDAANLIPAGSARVVYTAVPSGASFTQTSFVATNASALATPMGFTPAQLSAGKVGPAIDAIRAGGLGGVDHSTPAIIGPSSIAGSPSRPTVAYFGALDGMIHAVAISGAGLTPGRELWAFIPPSQLGKIAGYQAGVDGEPSVADAFITVAGKKQWRTLLAIPDGGFGGTIDVLDVTDPTAPQLLWEGASSTGGYGMGATRGAAFGEILQAGGPTFAVFVATNNAGSAGNGFNLYALDAGTGAVLWQFDHLYSRHIPGTTTLVPNDVPGVPAAADTAGDGGPTDRVYFGDLDGRVWEIDATFKSGAPAAPLFDAGVEGQPIANAVALYRDTKTQDLDVAGATGGADWVPSSVTPFLFSVDAQQHLSGTTGLGKVVFQTSLAAGERVYAAPTVAGNDIYLVTSFGNFGGNIAASAQDAGNIRRLDLATGGFTATTAVKKGASEVAVGADGSVVAASAAGETSLANSGRDAQGLAINNKPQRPFLVQAWIDLR